MRSGGEKRGSWGKDVGRCGAGVRGRTAGGDEHAWHPLAEAVVDETAEDGVLLDDEHAARAALAAKAQRGDRLRVAWHLEHVRLERVRHRGVAVLAGGLEQRDAARHRTTRRGGHAEGLPRARQAATAADRRTRVEHAIVDLLRVGKEPARFQTVPQLALRHLGAVDQRGVHGVEDDPELRQLPPRRTPDTASQLGDGHPLVVGRRRGDGLAGLVEALGSATRPREQRQVAHVHAAIADDAHQGVARQRFDLGQGLSASHHIWTGLHATRARKFIDKELPPLGATLAIVPVFRWRLV